MSYCTVNDSAALEARISMPRLGSWTADVVVDTDGVLKGVCLLQFGGVGLRGHVVRANQYRGKCHAVITGGRGGLRNVTRPKAYNDVPLRVPLTDMLIGCGELLSERSDADVVGAQLRWWTSMAQPVGRSLSALIQAAPDAIWRVLPNGDVWVGKETWQTAELDFDLVAEDPLADRTVIFSEVPSILPGMSFRTRHVSMVEHSLTAAGIRTSVWYEART